MSTYKIANDQWQKLYAFLQSHPRAYAGQEEKCRRFIEAVHWILRTGAQWRELPDDFGKCPTVFSSATPAGKRTVCGRRWKCSLSIPVVVCHYPTGASKYNPIEYRLFSQITRNGAGQPLRSFDIMLNDIRSTTTTTGLTVKAFLVDRAFQKGARHP